MDTAKKYGRRYPWDEWFKAREISLRKGEDYNGRTDTFATRIRITAGERGYKVSIRIDDDGEGMTVAFTKRRERAK